MRTKSDNRASSSPRGFTLIELVIVLTIFALMTAAVVPIYVGSVTWARSDRAVRDFVALMKYAQERALTDQVEYRFYMDYDTGAFWLLRFGENEDGEPAFVALDESDTGRRTLPENVSLEGTKARKDSELEAHYIAFHGSGACDYATVKLDCAGRKTVTIRTKGHLGQFEQDES